MRLVVFIWLAVALPGCLFVSMTRTVEPEPSAAELELRAEIEAARERIETLELFLAEYRKKFGRIVDENGSPIVLRPPPEWPEHALFRTTVTAVDPERNVVRFGAGRDAGVEPGYRVTVYRGDEYVATVVIETVAEHESSGFSKKELEKTEIRVGDQATNRF
jgi:hypothetical protein